MMRGLLLLLSTAALARGQTPQWRVTMGDDARWAEPGFDDSSWPLGPGPSRTLNSAAYVVGVRWYRATFPLSAGLHGEELAIGMGPTDDAYEVYVEGSHIGGFGRWEPDPVFYNERHLVIPVPPELVKSASEPSFRVAPRKCWPT